MQSLNESPQSSTVEPASGGITAPLMIAYGSQTGNAEFLAIGAAEQARQRGLDVQLVSMDAIVLEDITQARFLLVVTSTYDDAEMPDNAKDLWVELADSNADFSSLTFAVLAIGDSMYEDFCWAGRQFDEKLAELGAHRLIERVECDIDFDITARDWVQMAIQLFQAATRSEEPTKTVTAVGATGTAATQEESLAKFANGWSRKAPFQAPLVEARRLSGEASDKEVFHYELDLTSSGIVYEPGDSLAVVSLNPSGLVDELIDYLGAESTAIVQGMDAPIHEVLSQRLEIRLPPRGLVALVGRYTAGAQIERLLADGDHESIDDWLWGKDVLDVLRMVPPGTIATSEILAELKPLAHRTYSISSSPRQNPGRVALTVSHVIYLAEGRTHVGAATSYLKSRSAGGAPVSVFLSRNPSFRLPDDDEAPIIMVGPGTGVAPFRSFLLERLARGARGKNWLFFGDRSRANDWLYEDEFRGWSEAGHLRFDLAFSRDQPGKRYVQHVIRENAAELVQWLEDGAYLYICGDSRHMAKDVENAVLDIVKEERGLTREDATAYIDELKLSKHFQQDVY